MVLEVKGSKKGNFSEKVLKSIKGVLLKESMYG